MTKQFGSGKQKTPPPRAKYTPLPGAQKPVSFFKGKWGRWWMERIGKWKDS